MNPNSNGQGNPPQFTAAVKFDDGSDIPEQTRVGIFNMAGGLLGVGDVYIQDNAGGDDFSAVFISLQTDGNSAMCDSFLAPQMVRILLEDNAGSLASISGPFSGTTFNSGGLTFLNGPDGSTTFDTVRFSRTVFPVDLSNFSAAPADGKVNLAWSTSSETENSYFEVQRSTTQNGDFRNIGKVLGNETTTALSTYEFTDANPAEGTNYYRLQQFDNDGTSEFSPIVAADVALSAERSIAVFPNPTVAGGRLTVRLNGNWSAGGASLQLTDINGRKVAAWAGLSNGSLNTELPVLKAGVYQLIATDGQERKATRVVVR